MPTFIEPAYKTLASNVIVDATAFTGALTTAATTAQAVATSVDAQGDIPTSVSISAAAGASNICDVTITVKDGAGVTQAAVTPLIVWLSDAATGAGLTGTTASGTVQAKTASGTDIQVLTTKKAVLVQTLATGVYTLEITDSAKTEFYVCAAPLGSGTATIGTKLTAAKYG
jgi:hypothetical protein